MDAPATTSRRPVQKPFSPIAALDIELPIEPSALEEIGVRGLQSGCGDAVRRFWLNSDFRPLHDGAGTTTETGRVYRIEEDRYFIQHDVEAPFPIVDASLDWCYSEHLIEHLTEEQGIAWLADMRRMLKPGGFVRVSTPDLRKYAEGYVDPSRKFFTSHGRRVAELLGDEHAVERPAYMVNQTFFRWNHKWMYDLEELRHAAVEAGFGPDAVRRRAFRDSADPEVARMDIPAREDESLYVEIHKTPANSS
jgi:predicted SAM-dependent methyltransferase